MATPKKPKAKPICGHCGESRLVAKHTFEGAGADGNDLEVAPIGNVGVCPTCGMAGVLDWAEDEDLSNAPG